ncbi:MAG: poly-gamma-glutamate synthase PgsB [Candidatus Krumholzibacteria bacterium]|nr:poly-gamma-glutamate synthase PgsB [Candidatus Krumholzibacteria bacterium]MDP6669556.1 poly-gamma-glutamate synthase PgsB [Candidatus Krumholzibacteria bacterium]MDP7022298.1 poly-gamma-glutamate synthase PgsB [Candidatus Krumholzibacteria bacterium]
MELIFFLFALLLAAGLWETGRHRRVRQGIPVRIHVNGSRGKSSVTRLIAAGLRGGGMKVFAKTTGSAARMIHVDGEEEAIRRRGGPNIREQLSVFRQARKEGADALVLECMAVRPDLQWTSEQHIVHATHGVITNVRPDHLEAMGPRVENVAESLSNTIPRRAKLFACEERFEAHFEEVSRDRKTSFRSADSKSVSGEDLQGFSYVELPDNLALALDVCQDLGVDRDTALASMRKLQPDPGALIPLLLKEGNREIEFLNLFAANDPESTVFLWEHLRLGEREEETLAIINIRADRMRRSRDLAPLFGREIRADRYLLIGEQTAVFSEMLRRRRIDSEKILDLGGRSAEEVWSQVLQWSPPRSRVVGIGNIGGAGVELMSLLEKGRAA